MAFTTTKPIMGVVIFAMFCHSVCYYFFIISLKKKKESKTTYTSFRILEVSSKFN